MAFMLPSLNAIFISLAPKKGKEDDPSGFHAIALCNTIYKIISKFISNRPKEIMSSLIFEEKLRYVEGMQIIDSKVVVHEIIHSLHKTKWSNMIIKLDFPKDVDKLFQSYLYKILLSFGFSSTRKFCIHSLSSSMLFSILVNVPPS